MVLVFWLLCLLGAPLPVISAGSVVEHMSPADRRAAVNEVFSTFADQEPDVFRRRRLVKAGESAPPPPAPDDPENLGVLIDHWQYQLQRSKHARLLRGFGFTDEDGLPSRIPGYDLAKEFHSASESLGLLLWHLENRTKERQVKKARRLKALNTADRVQILEGAQRGEEFLRPEFLGVHPETGEYRFSLAGAYIGREEDRLPVVDNQGRRRLDLESFELPGLSNCKLSPVATYTKDVLFDDITDNERLHSGSVCECGTMHEAGESIPGPDVESVEDSKSVLGILQAFASLMGGDLCGKVDKIDTSDGFKTNLMVKASLFDKDKVKVWPVINVLFDNMPQLAVIKNVVVAVLPKVAGMKNMDEVKGKLNELAKMFMPDKLTLDIDIGKILADAYLNAERAAVKELEAASHEENQKDKEATAGGRRLAAQRQLQNARIQSRRLSYVLTDGLFDLGFIPPSDRHGEDSNAPCQEKRRIVPKPPPTPPDRNPTENKIQFKSSLANIRRQFGANSAEYKAAVMNYKK
eukprot:g2942.t1